MKSIIARDNLLAQAEEGQRKFWGFLQRANAQIVLLLLVFTAVSFYSVGTASGQETYEAIFKGATIPILKHVGIVVFSLTVAFIMPIMKGKYLQTFGTLFYILLCAFLLFMLVTNGSKVNNAERWVYIFNVSVQPSEFIKLGLIGIISLCSCLFHHRGDEHSKRDYWKYYGIPIACILALIVYIGISNISTAAIYLFVTAFLFFVCKMPWGWYVRTFGTLALLGLALLALVFILPVEWLPGRFSTVRARTERRLQSDEEKIEINDKNRQEQFGRIALANSQLVGSGIGQSKIKDNLPMAMSDYVYAVMIEELGLVALIGVPLLYVWWFLLIASMAKKEDDLFCKYLLYGIGLMFPFQALINIAVVSGLFTTGQPLPFLSAGGSSFLANCIVFGVMMIISRWQNERRLLALAKVSSEEEPPYDAIEASK